jgi:hypothetical protein
MGRNVTQSLVAFTLATAALALTTPAVQAQHAGHEASAAGRWILTVEGSPHGTTTMGLTLEQKGTEITGTFASPHGDIPVNGEFADRTLTLATVVRGDAPDVKFTAKLVEDDTLSGYLSSAMGDMTWTAARAKDK